MIYSKHYELCRFWGYATGKAAYPQLLDVMPTQESLKEFYTYNPHTGDLIRKYDGKLCQVPHRGYKLTYIEGKQYPVHRLIWVYVYGPFNPELEIDHINGNPSDNRLSNLRLVTHKENCRNLTKRRTTAHIGIDMHKCGKWRARIGAKSLGLFTSLKEAIAARKDAEQKHGYHPNHGRTQSLSVT